MNRVKTIEKQLPGASSSQGSVVVFGACFLDYVGYVGRMPKPGETLASESFVKGFGGKGANQAVMCSRLGGSCRMVSVVGEDGDGGEYIANLKKNGVDTSYVATVTGENTGLAMIFVDKNTAQNEIVICPNVTRKMTADYLRKETGFRFLDGCSSVVCQNEVPLDATLAVLEEASKRGIYTVFNTAPAPSKDDVVLIKPKLQFVSLFCPNETEASLITGINVTDVASAEEAVKALQRDGVRDVVITLGSKGFVLSQNGAPVVHKPAKRVKAVDTTGAGDCFVGSMAYFMHQGESLLSACMKANECAAYSVQRRGTQASYPFRNQVSADLFQK